MTTPAPTSAGAVTLPSTRRRGLALSERKLLLAAGDGAAVAVAFLAAYNLHTAEVRRGGFAIPRVALLITVLVWFAAAYLADGYRLSSTVNLRGTFRTVASSLAISFVGLLGVFFVVPYRITRPTLLLWVPLAGVAVLAWRLAYRQVSARAIFAGSLAVVANQQALQRVWPDVRGVMQGLYHVVGSVDPERPDCADILRELTDAGQVDAIILGVHEEISRDLFRCLVDCYDQGVPVRSLSELYEELTGRMLLDQLGHSWLLSLPMRSETSRVYSAFKRALDIVVGCVGLVTLALVLPFALVAVKLDDRGPLFFRQIRSGKYGHEFRILKLRTMAVDGAGEPRQTDASDERITRVGRVLRRLHLDELPQAWNVLKGEMSIIGPRPEQPAYVAMLQESIDFYKTRLSVRPGLTGWAQVNLGYAEGVEGAREKLSYDLYYIKRQSVALDLLILTRTFFAVLSLKGR